MKYSYCNVMATLLQLLTIQVDDGCYKVVMSLAEHIA